MPLGCHWDDVFAKTHDIGKALKDAFLGIEQANAPLHGIFGDASWTNKERLPDELLATLLNHFNQVNLGVASVRNDDMGRAYEYLIKRFADKANKKAGEFYKRMGLIIDYLGVFENLRTALPLTRGCRDARITMRK